MADRLEEIQILLQKRNARSRGQISSSAYNDTIDEISHDLANFDDQWNNRLVPLTSTLPNGTDDTTVDAFQDGLDGKTLYTNSRATSTLDTSYYNAVSSRPFTVYEQFVDVLSRIDTLQEDLEGQIDDLVTSAAQISIVDSGSLYDSVNVESALAEVMTQVNLLTVGSLDLSAVAQHYVPATDNTYDIGTAAKRLRDLYVAGASMHIQSKITDPSNPPAREYHFSINTTDGQLELLEDTTVIARFDNTAGVEFPLGGGSGALNDLTDVIAGSPVSGEALKWNGSNWVNDTDEAGTVNGSGAANKVAFWNAADTLSSSTNLHWDNGSSFLGIGIANPTATLHADTQTIIERNTETTGGAYYRIQRSRGSHASPTALLDGDTIGSVTFNAYNNGLFSGVLSPAEAGITAELDGTISAGSVPTRLLFRTKDVSSSTNAVRMTIKPDGKVGIGDQDPDEQLEVAGAIKIGAAVAAVDGTIRWTGTDFEGRKAGAWTSFTSLGIGDVTKVGTPVDDEIGIWTGDGTLEGDANFTWSSAFTQRVIESSVDGFTPNITRYNKTSQTGVSQVVLVEQVSTAATISDGFGPGIQFRSADSGASSRSGLIGFVRNDVGNGDGDSRFLVVPALNGVTDPSSSANRIFTILPNGEVGIGTIAPATILHLVSEADSSIIQERFGGSSVILQRSGQGTIASPTVTLSGNQIGGINSAGRESVGAWGGSAARIRFVAEENFSASAQGAFISWETIAAGGVVRTEKMRLTSDGNVGIGTTSPNSPDQGFGTTLEVAGASSVLIMTGGRKWNVGSTAGGTLNFFDQTAAATRLFIDTDGSVGIGTVSPGERLEVAGAIKIGAAVATVNGTIRWTGTDFEGRKAGAWASLTSTGTGDVTKVGTPVDNQIGVWTGDGTLEGDAKLTFNSATSNLDLQHNTASLLPLINIKNNSTTQTNFNCGLTIDAGWPSQGYIQMLAYGASGASTFAGIALANSFRMDTSDETSSFIFASRGGPIYLITGGSAAANIAMTIDTSQNIGIGVNQPDTLLHVHTTASTEAGRFQKAGAYNGANTILAVALEPTTPAVGDRPTITFRNSNSIDTVTAFGQIGVEVTDVANGTENGDFVWSLKQDGSVGPKMRLTSDGKLGVGTASPATILHVVSDADSSIIQERFGGTSVILQRSGQGTEASPTATLSGNQIGGINSAGRESVGAWGGSSARILFVAEENFSGSAQGAYISWETVAAGGTARTEKMRLTSSGNVGIGVSDPDEVLELSGAIHIGTTANSNDGTIRYTGSDFEGLVSGVWESLTDIGDNSYAEMYLVSGIATTVAVQGTALKANGTTADGLSSADFTVATTNRVTYNGVRTRIWKAHAACGVMADTGAQDLVLYIAKNGVVIDKSRILRRTGSGNDAGAVNIQCHVELSTSDYLEVWLTSDNGTPDVTISDMNFTVAPRS